MSYLCERMDDRQTAQELDETARLLRQALNDAAGRAVVRRAYDDDGNPVGSCVNNDCRIDCISQAWAAISGAGDPDKIEMGLRAMEEQLWCEEGQRLRLLAPPLRDDESELGYIKGYVPGVRENGGQYTHGAVWAVWAYVCVNRGDKAVELMRRLMPYWHAKTAGRRGGIWWSLCLGCGCTRWRRMWAGAAGPGTRARRLGCTKSRWKKYWGCRSTGTSSRSSPACRPTGRSTT